MKDAYKLSIENPCEKKNWNDMAEVGHDKFCSVCAKTVVDFAGWRDVDVISYLSKSKNPVCGRLGISQVDRLIELNPPYHINYWSKLIASVLVISSVTSVSAIEVKTASISTYHFVSNEKSKEIKRRSEQPASAVDSTKNKIKGKVVEKDTKQAVIDEGIVLIGTKIATQTDSLGNFELTIPDDFASTEITLRLVGSHGFEKPTEVTVLKSDLPIHNLIIEKKAQLIGEVMYKVIKKRKWWQFWRKLD